MKLRGRVSNKRESGGGVLKFNTVKSSNFFILLNENIFSPNFGVCHVFRKKKKRKKGGNDNKKF